MKTIAILATLALASCGTSVTFTPDGVLITPPVAPIVIPTK